MAGEDGAGAGVPKRLAKLGQAVLATEMLQCIVIHQTGLPALQGRDWRG